MVSIYDIVSDTMRALVLAVQYLRLLIKCGKMSFLRPCCKFTTVNANIYSLRPYMGATTLSIMTFSIMTFRITAQIIESHL